MKCSLLPSAVFFFVLGCGSADSREASSLPASTPGGPTGSPNSPSPSPDSEMTGASSVESISASQVFFGQTHVMAADAPGAFLISDRDTLVKVHAWARTPGQPAPAMRLRAVLSSSSLEFPLKGPALLPTTSAQQEHSFADSYTVILPRPWVRPGLELTVKVGDQTLDLRPTIGAPNPLLLTLLDVRVFKNDAALSNLFPWTDELAVKLPISALTMARKAPWLLKEVVIPPRPDVNLPAVRIRSTAEYKEKTGQAFNGEQGFALGLTNAVQAAAGHTRTSVYYTFLSGVGVGGGLADPFTAMGPAGNLAVLLHELGHTLSLPHWADNPRYPYQTALDGVPGDPGHVGPAWGFDSRQATLESGLSLPYFIPPTVQANTVGRTPGVFKKDPMAGGGSGDQEKGFFFRMFSDFSSRQMKTYLEAELVVSHPKPGQGGGGYGRWDGATATYKPLVVDGVFLPTQDDVPVYTLVYSTSATTAEANFLYEPQGPHTSGLLRAFDPSQNEDRSQARETLCKGRCDFTLRVTQGGKTYLNMVPGKWNPASKATSLDSFQVGALNVPAHRGAVQNAKLLLTPNVAVDGLPSNPRVLYHYEP